MATHKTINFQPEHPTTPRRTRYTPTSTPEGFVYVQLFKRGGSSAGEVGSYLHLQTLSLRFPGRKRSFRNAPNVPVKVDGMTSSGTPHCFASSSFVAYRTPPSPPILTTGSNRLPRHRDCGGLIAWSPPVPKDHVCVIVTCCGDGGDGGGGYRLPE